MPSLEQDIINGVGDEDRILEEMLRAEEQRSQPQRPQVEVIQTPSPKKAPSKLLVHIPTASNGKPDHTKAVVTKVEVLPNGDYKTVELARPITNAERALVLSSKKEVLSSPIGEDAAEDDSGDDGWPWWAWALAGAGSLAVVGVGTIIVKNKFFAKAGKKNPAEEEFEEDDVDDEDDEDED